VDEVRARVGQFRSAVDAVNRVQLADSIASLYEQYYVRPLGDIRAGGERVE
jgi:hypothetical protein